MRTSVALDEDVRDFVICYARGHGISLSAALNELIRKAESVPAVEPEIVFSSDGFPMFPPANGTITSEMVKTLEEEEFDPEKFT
jgi:hypothetical protein